jgi:hypothetical protein
LNAPSVSVQPNTASSICLSGSTQGEGKASPHGREAIKGSSSKSMLPIMVMSLLHHKFGFQRDADCFAVDIGLCNQL